MRVGGKAVAAGLGSVTDSRRRQQGESRTGSTEIGWGDHVCAIRNRAGARLGLRDLRDDGLGPTRMVPPISSSML